MARIRRTSWLALCLLLGMDDLSAQPHPWLSETPADTLAERILPPPGYTRLPASPGSFVAWLRGLPLHPGRPDVRLYNGRKKANQGAQYAVLAVDVGDRDLQQCADAVIRLRAEYLLAAGCEAAITFNFTSGDPASWPAWKQGERPRVSGNQVRWIASARPDGSYANFRRYLDTVFTYAGSYSLSRELEPVADPAKVEPGDVFIQGGFPGHAVLVVDVAVNEGGKRVFLLAQSFMPAQEIHILKNPAAPENPWYPAAASGVLQTPEWRFEHGDLRRFPVSDCAQSAHCAPCARCVHCGDDEHHFLPQQSNAVPRDSSRPISGRGNPESSQGAQSLLVGDERGTSGGGDSNAPGAGDLLW